jgi:hypothetical protein
VLQYTHVNPEDGGKVYIVETDVTLGDLGTTSNATSSGGKLKWQSIIQNITNHWM